VDRDEHGVGIALGKFSGLPWASLMSPDLDHILSVTILAGLRRRTQIAPIGMCLKLLDLDGLLERTKALLISGLFGAHIRSPGCTR
jgi:hypothetical protein